MQFIDFRDQGTKQVHDTLPRYPAAAVCRLFGQAVPVQIVHDDIGGLVFAEIGIDFYDVRTVDGRQPFRFRLKRVASLAETFRFFL